MSLRETIKVLRESDNFWAGLFREFISVSSLVAIFVLVSYIVFGLWTPMVAIKSESMVPHLQIGDIIFVGSIDRTDIITHVEGKEIGYVSFENYGDVILYKRYGREDDTPIIHRAMYYVEKGEQMWENGPPAPHSGYITKGDNDLTNPIYDQQGSVSINQPIEKKMIIGVARFQRIPLLGYISLIPRMILQAL